MRCLLTDLLYEEGVPVAPLVDDHGAGVQQLPVPAADPVLELQTNLREDYSKFYKHREVFAVLYSPSPDQIWQYTLSLLC